MGKMNEDNLRAVKIFFTDISSSVLSIIGVPVSSVTQAAGKINSIIFMYSENKNLVDKDFLEILNSENS